jgi:DNA-binding response OmpR family regulator
MMKPISVLLVDDNPTFLRIATRFLQEDEGVVVVGTAGGGEEALTQAQTLRPQVILLDLAMPDLPGLEAIPFLRNILPEAGIIALTLMNTAGYRKAAFAAGANDFIPKTVMSTELLPAIRCVIQANGGQQEMVDTTQSIQEKGSTQGAYILVLEDDAHLRRLFSKVLKQAGYEVYPAATTEEAQGLLAQQGFDVFLCDVHVGDDLGTDLLRQHLATLSLHGTQVVVVSGEAQYRPFCEEMGVDFYLEKPVALDTLLTVVKRLTGRNGTSSVDWSRSYSEVVG